MRRFATVAMLLAPLSALAACGGSDATTPENVEQKVAEQLTGSEGFDEETADCIASGVLDQIGADRLAELYSDDPVELPQEVKDAVVGEVVTCFDPDADVESIPESIPAE
jgi:hypothetical protein